MYLRTYRIPVDFPRRFKTPDDLVLFAARLKYSRQDMAAAAGRAAAGQSRELGRRTWLLPQAVLPQASLEIERSN